MIKDHKKILIICIAIAIFSIVAGGSKTEKLGELKSHISENQNEGQERITEYLEEVEEGTEVEETEEIENFGDTVSKIGDCLYEQVPEIGEWDEYVKKKTDGKAYIYSRYDSRVEDVYRNGEGSEYFGKYYSVYVGEMWEDHSANWDWFYVSEDFDEVLWCEIVECEPYSLEDWRASLQYKRRQERITEYLEEVEEGIEGAEAEETEEIIDR